MGTLSSSPLVAALLLQIRIDQVLSCGIRYHPGRATQILLPKRAYLETIEMNSSFLARFLVTENDQQLVTQSYQLDNPVAVLTPA